MSDLHGQIMNIRCSPADYMSADMRHIYRVGHRDARHAAAELVAAHEAEAKRAVPEQVESPVAKAARQLKDHEFRDLVNELRDIAHQYHATEQLRERIAHTLRCALLGGES